jgi:membrane-bound lytic murein transglycosylase A
MIFGRHQNCTASQRFPDNSTLVPSTISQKEFSMKRAMMVVLGAALFGLGACQSTPAPFIPAFESVDDQVEGYGLFKLDPADYPDMSRALADREGLLEAVEKSIQYMEAAGSKRFFPATDPISHDQVYAGLLRFREMLKSNMPSAAIQAEVQKSFEMWASRGYNWRTKPANEPGKVWFTGYFTPIYRGSRTKTAEFQYPIYSRPDDLVTDPLTGDLIGQKQADGTIKPGYYPSRAELMANGAQKLAGKELLWFAKPMEPYIIQVQGSAKVITPAGEEIYVGYSGSNGGEYLGLGTQLRQAGILTAKEVSLPNVLKFFEKHPEEREVYINRSARFVFMKEYTTPAEKANWPSGSIGRQVTPTRSLATDKKIFPRAAITLMDVTTPDSSGGMKQTQRLLLDQDTGGAIRAAGRADIYYGIGGVAGSLAGRQFSEGVLFYIVLKQSESPSVIQQFGKKPAAAAAPKAPATPAPAAPKAPAAPSVEIFPK